MDPGYLDEDPVPELDALRGRIAGAQNVEDLEAHMSIAAEPEEAEEDEEAEEPEEAKEPEADPGKEAWDPNGTIAKGLFAGKEMDFDDSWPPAGWRQNGNLGKKRQLDVPNGELETLELDHLARIGRDLSKSHPSERFKEKKSIPWHSKKVSRWEEEWTGKKGKAARVEAIKLMRMGIYESVVGNYADDYGAMYGTVRKTPVKPRPKAAPKVKKVEEKTEEAGGKTYLAKDWADSDAMTQAEFEEERNQHNARVTHQHYRKLRSEIANTEAPDWVIDMALRAMNSNISEGVGVGSAATADKMGKNYVRCEKDGG